MQLGQDVPAVDAGAMQVVAGGPVPERGPTVASTRAFYHPTEAPPGTCTAAKPATPTGQAAASRRAVPDGPIPAVAVGRAGRHLAVRKPTTTRAGISACTVATGAATVETPATYHPAPVPKARAA